MEMIVAGAIFLLTIFPTSAHETIRSSISPAPSPSTNSEVPKTTNNSPIIYPTEIPNQPITHIIESGDTLDRIAKEHYGSPKFWTTLWNDNDFIEDPRIIRSGMELNIRNETPEEAEELNEKLARIYEELTAPTPTPTSGPKQEVASATSQPPQGNPSSFDEAYRQAGSRFGVPWEILYGLHHMETGGRDGAISSGYGTGAQGPLQFMPGTWAAYGIDGNGDGSIDINNAIDAIFGAANYIATHGGVEQGLKSYGGNVQLVLDYARSRGYSQ